MARKPNYDFEKRRKEMDRKAKKDAKRDEKLRRKEAGIVDEEYPPATTEITESEDFGPATPDQD